MTETESLKCLAVLTVFDRVNWSSAQIEAWTRAIITHRDSHAGMRASEALVEGLDSREWSLHRWRQAYRQEVAADTAQRSLPPSREPIVSLKQAMASLATREAAGDPEAIEALSGLRQYSARSVLPRAA